ncbi:hypothetical protein [Sinomicrobium weinanense]|uniref:Uncharacterized protein n=1 Tax=Sinomicrobium weinanense TaxID=2842200 RepID=A0A926Q0N3_9FLAO|nr:hypothetical protein [Sinomicrobium weinanense]MBC9795082.1 hypothetical protein [Sinomicrobium weinanense]MBU3123787.1 hypothetical protein [Sinomicrobium weinanense]
MNFIKENKLELHLKLGRKLARFVKTDLYFNSRTFDWLKLEKTEDQYKAALIRSFDGRLRYLIGPAVTTRNS